MRINQNISALNAYRNMVNTDNRLNKSLERLSSGLRINRAADDAAGLAISEKMRGQIRGLNQAMSNAQDGISLIQTAEGALNETHSILQRMRELSVQAANDTLTAGDRMEIQKEIDQLTREIDRIADTTEFNTKKLLDGTTSALTSTSDLKTKVFMRDGLRVIDQFGQKAVEGGNFRLNIEAEAGVGQVQKTDIMKIKHDRGEASVEMTQEAVLLGMTADETTATSASVTADDITYTAVDAGWSGNGITVDLVAATSASTATVAALSLGGNTVTVTLSISTGATIDATRTEVVAAIAADSSVAAVISASVETAGTAAIGSHDLIGGSEARSYTLGLANATGGNFTLEFTNDADVVVTRTYAYDVTAGNIESDLVEETTLSVGQISVLQGTDGNFQITFNASVDVQAFSADITGLTGVTALNEQQTVTVDAQGGTFTLTFDGATTGPIAYDAAIGVVQTDINAALLAEHSDANRAVNVSGDPGAWIVEFSGSYYAGQPQSLMTIDSSLLEGFGEIGQVANTDTALRDIDRFWDASGNFLVRDPQTINLVQGDGNQTSFTIFGTDTIQDVQDKLNNAIHEGLGQKDFNTVPANEEAYVRYVTANDQTSEFFSVGGTFIIQSAVTGSDGEITFVGDENIINALSLTTIREASETQYTVEVYNAHTESLIDGGTARISGNMLIGIVHQNVDVKFDAMAGLTLGVEADPGRTQNAFTWTDGDTNTYVHLADNSMVFHIGANPLQDVDAAIGDMRAEALGVDNILVTNQKAANRAITQIDNAINRVSSERSKMGALQNRLEHTINNLGVAAENLTAAESRIRDLDFALEMVEFTRNQIMQQASTAMLAQANMKPQSVLMLLG